VILGLPLAARADSARPHDVVAARELLRDRLPDLPSVRAIVGDRAYRGLGRLGERKHLALDIKAPPPGVSGFVPIRPLDRIEHGFAQLGHWRRLSRCYEGSEARPGPGSRSPESAIWPGARQSNRGGPTVSNPAFSSPPLVWPGRQ
jgi:hypothetical protein